MFDDVTVTFNNRSPLAVTDYKLVNDGDSVYVDYTINSAAQDMYSITVERSAGSQNGIERTVINVTDNARRRSYSDVLKLKMQRDGKTSYRIYAMNQKGTYIGDGYKKVTIEVNPSYMIYANRNIYLPDTAAKVLPAYFSLSDATSYSYTNGQANSAKIDFGIWRRPNPSTTPQDVATNPYVYNLYSISAPTNPFPLYDVSAWTKRATKFSAPQTSQTNTFLYNAVSASTIDALAKARNPGLTAINATNFATGLSPGCTICFLTPEGKYGIMLVNAITSDYERRPYINVSVKIQR
ncbi:hypothetical protein [Mucilaginibacter sp. PAMB04168]|uniref:hypothetical protein n=1 Tax=Mucilaginibacter sp. PAMB04168 TaxID=3138567 RepID=UPI0031F64708